jgi:hypothetical protein
MVIEILLLIMAALCVFSGLYSISIIGRPRVPMTHGAAVSIVIFQAAWAAVLILAALKLGI